MRFGIPDKRTSRSLRVCVICDNDDDGEVLRHYGNCLVLKWHRMHGTHTIIEHEDFKKQKRIQEKNERG